MNPELSAILQDSQGISQGFPSLGEFPFILGVWTSGSSEVTQGVSRSRSPLTGERRCCRGERASAPCVFQGRGRGPVNALRDLPEFAPLPDSESPVPAGPRLPAAAYREPHPRRPPPDGAGASSSPDPARSPSWGCARPRWVRSRARTGTPRYTSLRFRKPDWRFVPVSGRDALS